MLHSSSDDGSGTALGTTFPTSTLAEIDPALVWSGGPGGVNAVSDTVNRIVPSCTTFGPSSRNVFTKFEFSAENPFGVVISLPENVSVSVYTVPLSLTDNCSFSV